MCVRDVEDLVGEGRPPKARSFAGLEEKGLPGGGRGMASEGSLGLLVYRLETESDLRGFEEVRKPLRE